MKVSIHWSWALSLALLVGSAQAAKLVAGPMAGPAAMRSAVVWLQADSAAEARIEYWPKDAPQAKATSAAVKLDAREDFSIHLELAPLEPGRDYAYRVLLDDQAVGSFSLKSQPLWQWRGDPPAFKVLFGSCAYINEADYDRPGRAYGGGNEIFTSMAAKQPDLTLWLGDNVYFREVDYDSRWGMAYRYRHDRALPEWQALLQTGQHAAIWDDHDFGPNDSNSSFVFKDESLKLFQRYWANPSYGLPGVPGIFTLLHFGDADFFLLDDRWYRDNDELKGEPRKQMFGEAQLRWLKNALMNSTATFKIIAAGGQMLNEYDRWEGWTHFPRERGEFLSWLAQQGVKGVFFLSGDRHYTELVKLDRPYAYPLYDFTCSPLTAGPAPIEGERDKPNSVRGTVVGERNFCGLEFRGKSKAREVVLRSFNARGETLWEQVLNEAALGYTKP
jgi:alkaline phosphatase D